MQERRHVPQPPRLLHLLVPARLPGRGLLDRDRRVQLGALQKQRHLSPLHQPVHLQVSARLPGQRLLTRLRLLPGKIKLLINSDINYVLISVFSYLFVNKTIEDKSESEAL